MPILLTPFSFNDNSNYIAETECTLEIRCPNRLFNHSTVIDENGGTLFTLDSATWGTSWSVRRSLRDATGQHILDVRHYRSSIKQWIIEDVASKEICLIKDSTSMLKKITVVEAQATTTRGLISVSMRSLDHGGSTTLFEIDDAAIAELALVENNDLSSLNRRGLARSVWKLRVARGVDIALVLAMAFVRAEISHVWRR